MSEYGESILDTVKESIGGLTSDYTAFDTEIITHINGVLMALGQMGIGNEFFSIKDSTATWSDFMDEQYFEAAKEYVTLKVKILFDGNSMSSALMTSYENTLKEYEYRLYVYGDNLRIKGVING